MRKHIMLATLIGFCALSLTACQRGEDKPAAPAAGASAEQNMPANPSSEPLNTASNGAQEQNANNGTQDLAATNTPSPAQDNLQTADSSSSTGAMAPSTDAGTGTAPADQSGAAMQGSAPADASKTPTDQAPAAGSDNANAPAGADMAPSTDDKDKDKDSSATTPAAPEQK